MTDLLCISPIDGSELARRPVASEAEIEATLRLSRAAQPGWAAAPLAARKAVIAAFVAALEAANPEIVPELAWQMGRPVRYGGELRSLKERVAALLDLAEVALADDVPAPIPGYERRIKRMPAGVVLIIAPWNYPYLTAINTLVPALLAGNAVVLKHSAQTLLVGERIAAALATAGLPPGVFANVFLSHETTAKVIAARAVDHVTFTGSVAGGRAIERAAAGRFIGLGLELGGKDPAYVRPDAPLADTVAALVDGAVFNSGQCCCGIERIYVHAAVYEEFIARYAALAGGYVLGNPLDPATTLGPMAAVRFAETVRAHVAEAVSRGARALVDPESFPADRPGSPYVMAQALTGVDHSMRLMREETFGPVAGIMKVGSDEEAIALMNDSDYGLTASIWTTDMEAAGALGDRIATGTVFMNRCDYVDPYLAWTGVKDTGRGASLSRLGFESVTRPRSYHFKQL
jgi:acyl-CoA reductase-like NAD-dependent aldehyde dehydrogenase